jgi:hypothetical protein
MSGSVSFSPKADIRAAKWMTALVQKAAIHFRLFDQSVGVGQNSAS